MATPRINRPEPRRRLSILPSLVTIARGYFFEALYFDDELVFQKEQITKVDLLGLLEVPFEVKRIDDDWMDLRDEFPKSLGEVKWKEGKKGGEKEGKGA